MKCEGMSVSVSYYAVVGNAVEMLCLILVASSPRAVLCGFLPPSLAIALSFAFSEFHVNGSTLSLP